MSARRWFRDLPLFWKLLVPFVTLLLIVGTIGGVAIVRGLAADAQARLEADLGRASLDARGALQARELYLLEAASLAANLTGMPEALEAGDPAAVDDLLQTVRVLKEDLTLLATVDATGAPLVAYRDGTQLVPPPDTVAEALVADLLAAQDTDRLASLVTAPEHTIAIAAPVCRVFDRCTPVGAAVVGLRADSLLPELSQATFALDDGAGFALYDADGTVLARRGAVPASATDVTLDPGQLLRRSETVDGTAVQVLYAPLELQGTQRGVVAVALPETAALAGVRTATRNLTLVLLLAVLGIVGVGAAVARLVTGSLRPVLETNQRLGAGELEARAPVHGQDEIGELARGLNAMAGELQASRATLESRVEQRTAEVRRLLEQRTQFFASLSHELRTPLAIILSEAELLHDDVAEGGADSVRAVTTSASNLLATVNDILDVARAEADQLSLDRAPIDVASALVELRPTAQALARGSGLRFTSSIDSDCGVVAADADRFRELVLNLLDNAVKYTRAGGTVGLDATAADGAVTIEVSDTGIGIPPEVGDDLFEPFFTVPGNRTTSGQASSGLGMALTRQLVLAHDGRISYRSTPGEGTTFTVELPLVDDAEPGSTTSARTEAGSASG